MYLRPSSQPSAGRAVHQLDLAFGRNMRRALFIITGVSVVFTTLAFGHIMYHDTVHMLARHEESHLFVAVHTVVAAALGVLSLPGADLLLSGGPPQIPRL